MYVIISTLVMVVVLISIVIAERKCGRRSDEFFKRNKAEMDTLTDRVVAKYRARYGKDPTSEHRPVKLPLSYQGSRRK